MWRQLSALSDGGSAASELQRRQQGPPLAAGLIVQWRLTLDLPRPTSSGLRLLRRRHMRPADMAAHVPKWRTTGAAPVAAPYQMGQSVRLKH